ARNLRARQSAGAATRAGRVDSLAQPLRGPVGLSSASVFETLEQRSAGGARDAAPAADYGCWCCLWDEKHGLILKSMSGRCIGHNLNSSRSVRQRRPKILVKDSLWIFKPESPNSSLAKLISTARSTFKRSTNSSGRSIAAKSAPPSQIPPRPPGGR